MACSLIFILTQEAALRQQLLVCAKCCPQDKTITIRETAAGF